MTDWPILREDESAPVAPALDPIVEANVAALRQRSQLGIAKYGTTLAASTQGRAEFLQHAIEEHLDAANYLRWLLVDELKRMDDGR